jgi:hypothetical protein
MKTTNKTRQGVGRCRSRKGLVILFVVIIIAMTGSALLYLSSASNTMIYQSNNAYLKVCQRNLITSGLEWAGKNIQNGNSQNFDTMTELNIADMNMPNSSLQVKITGKTDQQKEIQIRTSNNFGRHHFKSDDTFIISSAR